MGCNRYDYVGALKLELLSAAVPQLAADFQPRLQARAEEEKRRGAIAAAAAEAAAAARQRSWHAERMWVLDSGGTKGSEVTVTVVWLDWRITSSRRLRTIDDPNSANSHQPKLPSLGRKASFSFLIRPEASPVDKVPSQSQSPATVSRCSEMFGVWWWWWWWWGGGGWWWWWWWWWYCRYCLIVMILGTMGFYSNMFFILGVTDICNHQLYFVAGPSLVSVCSTPRCQHEPYE